MHNPAADMIVYKPQQHSPKPFTLTSPKEINSTSSVFILSITSFDTITEELNSLLNCSNLAARITVFPVTEYCFLSSVPTLPVSTSPQ